MRAKASFIKPMLLLRADALPADAGQWEYQLKLDGYRAIAFRTDGKVYLRSRNDNDFGVRYGGVPQGLARLPPETVIDGEVVALDPDAVGPGADEGQDGGLPLAEARTGRSVRISRMDRREPSPAYALHGPARRHACA